MRHGEIRRWTSRVVAAGTGTALIGTALTAWNRCTVPRLIDSAAPVTETVTVCVPARDEADRLPALIGDLRAQTGIADLRILVLDDASADGTAEHTEYAFDGDPRCTLVRGRPDPPPGWTGKAAACRELAESTAAWHRPDRGLLVFLDADIRLRPGALAAAATELRRRELALLSAWPVQLARTPLEQAIQPLLCWSWASTLPIRWADRGSRTSTVVACGQFLVFDSAAYRAIGGHSVVAGSATEDLDIARALRRHGYRTAVAAAGGLARTRMYRDADELAAGYGRWLWSAYGGSISGGLAVSAVAGWAYWLPPLAAVLGRDRLRRIGLLGYGAAIAGRILARGLESGRAPRTVDLLAAAAHPVSVTGYFLLWGRSHRLHRRGALTWKGRVLGPGPDLDSR